MGVHILHDPDYARRGAAVLICSTSGVAFGPVIEPGYFDDGKRRCRFDAEEIAQTFLRWLGEDPRHLADTTLASKWSAFIAVGVKGCDYCQDNATAKTQRFCSAKCERGFEEDAEDEKAVGGTAS